MQRSVAVDRVDRDNVAVEQLREDIDLARRFGGQLEYDLTVAKLLLTGQVNARKRSLTDEAFQLKIQEAAPDLREVHMLEGSHNADRTWGWARIRVGRRKGWGQRVQFGVAVVSAGMRKRTTVWIGETGQHGLSSPKRADRHRVWVESETG